MTTSAQRVRSRRWARFGLVLLVAVAFDGAQGRQVRSDAPVLDPLTAPRPELSEPLVLPFDGLEPAQRIVATMPAALREIGDAATVPVIVTLHEPLAGRGQGVGERERALQLARIAAVEHDFVEAAGRLGFRASGALSHFPIVLGEIAVERLTHLAALRQVRAIQPDRPLRAARVQGAALIHADQVRDDIGGDGEGVTVVVLDSGIDAGHSELAGKVDVVRSHNGPAGVDTLGHGTQVAGIIAGDGGLAPQASLWDVKVIGNDGLTTIGILLEALNGLMPDMANLDILVGAFADPTFRFPNDCDALDPASVAVVGAFRNAGKLLVSAAGDAGDAANIAVPACLTAILATGAVYDANVGAVTFADCTDNSTAADKIACYSNSGSTLDFWAPAHNARSPQPGGGFDQSFGGTSAATAYVAGVAAQLWSVLPGATLTQLENALRNTGPNITDPRNSITRRRIDALAAYNSLAQSVPTATPPAPTPTRTATPQGPGPTPTNTPQAPGPTPTPPSGSPPAAPSGLDARVLSQSAVLLEWNDNSNDENDFQIRARTGGASFQEVLVVSAGTAFAAIEDLVPGTAYDFQVRARNGAGPSSFSNTASATTAGAASACVPGADTACLLGGLFRISGEMRNFATPPLAFDNQVMSFAGGRAESDQAVFFESFEAGNFEIGVKMVNGCVGFPAGHPLHGFWTFFGGLTNQFTDVTVRDTVTGELQGWINPANQFPITVSDTMAFPCENLQGTPSCVRDGETACLLNGRFEVTGFMRNAQNQEFVTKVIQFAQNRAETNQAVFFESFNPGNFEVGVKMLDACSLPDGHPLRFYWIFYGGLTSAYTEVIAVHVPTGRVDVWRNPPNVLPMSEGRTQAFPCS